MRDWLEEGILQIPGTGVKMGHIQTTVILSESAAADESKDLRLLFSVATPFLAWPTPPTSGSISWTARRW